MNAAVYVVLFSIGTGLAAGQNSVNSAKGLEEIKALRSEAERLVEQDKFEEALALQQRVQTLVDQEVFPLRNQAFALMRNGDYQSALALFKQGVTFAEEALGPNNPNLLPLLNDLITCYGFTGEFHLADSRVKQVLALLDMYLPMLMMQGKGRQLAIMLYNVAIQYRARGEYVFAETLYRRSLEIRERMDGPESPSVATVLNGLGLLKSNKGEVKEALPLFQHALAIIDRTLQLRASISQLTGTEVHDKETERGLNFDLIAALNGLAAVHEANGEFSESDRLLQRAISVSEKAFGDQSMAFATSLNNAGVFYKSRGQYDEAEKLLLRAVSAREKLLGRLHPATAESFSNLGSLYLAKGQIDQALQYMKMSEESVERNQALMLNVGSERQKHLFMNTRAGEVDAIVSMHTRSAPDNPEALRLALTAVLRHKGRILDVMADTFGRLRLRLNPDDQRLFSQLLTARSQLATRYLSDTGEEPASSLTSLDSLIQTLESELSARSAQFRVAAQSVSIENIQQAIPPDAALIEIFSYLVRDEKAGLFGTKRWLPPRYVAYVLRSKGDPQWADLGERAIIDDEVKQLRAALRNPRSGQRGYPDLAGPARELYKRIIAPVRPLFTDARRLLISPDGSLNLIPLGALKDEQNRYLVQDYSISYLTSGRDLLRTQQQIPNSHPPLVVAGPLFDGSPNGADNVSTDTERRSPEFQQQFVTLGGAAKEGIDVAQLLGVKALADGDATETLIKNVHGPRILHIATHGFFLPDSKSDHREPGRLGELFRGIIEPGENPLLRSGLALAGANKLRGGNGEDGILTALEASGLDLWGTNLVVLSACDTGLGDVQNAEGVWGLRRALVLGGADSQIMSLWKVNDDQTQDLMVRYYGSLLHGEGRSDALRKVQLSMIDSRGKANDHSHPYYWASFIESGDWRSLPAGDPR